MNKELNILIDLINTATKEGAFNLNQVNLGIQAINSLTTTLIKHGIISEKDEEAGSKKNRKESEKVS